MSLFLCSACRVLQPNGNYRCHRCGSPLVFVRVESPEAATRKDAEPQPIVAGGASPPAIPSDADQTGFIYRAGYMAGLAEAKQERDDLMAALVKHGEHHNCEMFFNVAHREPGATCVCGLDAILARKAQ